MSQITYFNDLGLRDYQEVWDQQEQLFMELIDIKRINFDMPQCEQTDEFQHLIFCEHPHVYTLGKSGDADNLLISQIELQAKNAQFVKTNRGGDITYHGPGQLVGYPIFNLEAMQMSVKEYIYGLEETIIRVIAQYGLKGKIVDGAIGVWLDATENLPERKICAIGVKVSRGVSMHGFALNINTNLDYFKYINPCGFIDKSVTSLQKELGMEMNFDEVKLKVKEELKKTFQLQFSEFLT
jgi:lipoyl(octanoyl) transferase